MCIYKVFKKLYKIDEGDKFKVKKKKRKENDSSVLKC